MKFSFKQKPLVKIILPSFSGFPLSSLLKKDKYFRLKKNHPDFSNFLFLLQRFLGDKSWCFEIILPFAVFSMAEKVI